MNDPSAISLEMTSSASLRQTFTVRVDEGQCLFPYERRERGVANEVVSHCLGGQQSGEEERHPTVGLGLGQERGLEFSSIPECNGMIGSLLGGASRGEAAAVGREGDRQSSPGHGEAEQFLRRLDVPEFHRGSRRGRGEAPTVARERHALDTASVARQGDDLGAGRRIPDLDGLVDACGREGRPSGWKVRSVTAAVCPRRVWAFFRAEHVPDRDCAVVASGREPPAVARERHREELLLIGGGGKVTQCIHSVCRGEVPDLQRAEVRLLLSGTSQPAGVRRELEAEMADFNARKWRSRFPAATSQNLTVWSALPDASQRPSVALQATEVMSSVWPRRVRTTRAVLGSQIRTARSELAEASERPSGENAMLETPEVPIRWSWKGSVLRSAVASQMRTVPSVLAEASRQPSGL